MDHAINYGDDSKRSLYSDDINGINYLYPAGPSAPDGGTLESGPAFLLKAESSIGKGIGVQLRLAEATDARLSVYSEDGTLMTRLADGYLQAGDSSYHWDTSQDGPAVYFVAFDSELGHTARRIFVLK